MGVAGLLDGVLMFVAGNVTVSLVLLLTLLYLGSEILPGAVRRLPPAPWQFPIIGSLPALATKPEEFFDKLRKKYGDLYRVWFGDKDTIVLGSYKAVKEAFITNGENFSGRVQTFNLQGHLWSYKGILAEDGWAWKEQRRFALSTLRDFGFGRFTMEEKILEEADRVTKLIKTFNGAPFDLRPYFRNATANVICSVTFGKSFEYDDKEFMDINGMLEKLENSMKFPLVVFLPWTRFISKRLSGMAAGDQFKVELQKFTQKYIDEHKATYDESIMRDYLDCYLAEMYKRQKKNTKDVGTFDEIRLRSNLFLMFLAGVSSTSNTLNWAFRLLVAYPDMQAELHEEIDRVVGTDRQVSYADRMQMPRAEAFLSEVHRFADVVPLGVPHTNYKETKLFGYEIPERSNVMPYMRGVHQDPELWGDPENFRPSRFIDEKGMLLRPEYLIPFGVGKRACMGEVLARTELFLLMTTLLQRFTFVSPDGVDTNVLSIKSLVRSVPPYKVCATSRTH